MSKLDDRSGTPPVTSELSSAAPSSVRPDVQQLIVALGNAIVRSATDRDLAAVFEREVERLLSIPAVRLREIPARYQVRRLPASFRLLELRVLLCGLRQP